MQVNPRHSNTLKDFGNFLFREMKNLEEGEAMFRRALEQERYHARTLQNLSKLLLDKMRSHKADAVALKAESMDLLKRCDALWWCPLFLPAASLSHTRAHTLARALSLSLSHTHTHTPALFTRTLTFSLTDTLALSHTPALSRSLILPVSDSLPCAHALSCAPCPISSPPPCVSMSLRVVSACSPLCCSGVDAHPTDMALKSTLMLMYDKEGMREDATRVALSIASYLVTEVGVVVCPSRRCVEQPPDTV